LAELYGVTTKRLNEQVKRNLASFPKDFMFQLTKNEKEDIILQFKQYESLKFSSTLLYALTEYGTVMPASVLNREQAVKINIQIVKIFIKIRQMITDNTEIRLAIEKLEKMTLKHTKSIELVFQYIDELSEKVSEKTPRKNRVPIGCPIPNKKT
jgi:ORF6N domain